MVQADQRGSLSHAVALNDDKSERVPEPLQGLGQGRAAADEGPKLETEPAMDLAKMPPLAPSRKTLCLVDVDVQVSLQDFENAGHGDQDGNAFIVNRLYQIAGNEAGFEMDIGGQQPGNPDAHKLPKYVT